MNRIAVPFDPRPPLVSSGLRIGTPALATRSFGDAEFYEVADIIAEALMPGRQPAPKQEWLAKSRHWRGASRCRRIAWSTADLARNTEPPPRLHCRDGGQPTVRRCIE